MDPQLVFMLFQVGLAALLPILVKLSLLGTATWLIAKDKLGPWWYGIILLILLITN